MLGGFYIAASALSQQQRALEVVDNNISNLNTTGFKGSRALFSDVFVQTIKLGGQSGVGAASTTNPIQVGQGTAVTAIAKNFSQGEVGLTGQPLDLGLLGKGLFVFRPPTAARQSPYFTRNGHLSVDANNGAAAVPNNAGPIKLVNDAGYTLQGINGTIDPLTGGFTLSAASPPTPVDITFDQQGSIGPFTTSAATFGFNLDSSSPRAIDPIVLAMSKQGVDRTARIEFTKASMDAAGSSYYFYNVTSTVANAAGAFPALTDSVTGAPITGVMQLDGSGNVAGLFANTDADGFLTTAEVAALDPLAQGAVPEALTHNASGADGQSYATSVRPVAASTTVTVNGVAWTRVAAFTAAPNEFLFDDVNGRVTFGAGPGGDAPPATATITATYTPINRVFTVGPAPIAGIVGEAALRPAIPAAIPMALAAPAVFNLGAAFDANSTAITLNGRTLVRGVDYTETPATGDITPLTAWAPGNASVSYTRAAGATVVTNQQAAIANALPNINFASGTVPIDQGTLVINAFRGGAALVENADYSVDYTTGKITPLTYWDPTAGVTLNYSQADTRIIVEHNVTGLPSGFRAASATEGGTAAPTLKSTSDFAVGAPMSPIDSLGNEHFLDTSLERQSNNRWIWASTPTYRLSQAAAAINDSTSGGGTAGTDGMTVLPNTLIANPDGTFQITLKINEGSGQKEWTQIPSAAAFGATGGATRFFKVVNPATGEIAFSRDITTSSADFNVYSTYKANATTGNGILAFDANGVFDATNSITYNPITFTPQGAAALTIAPNFAGMVQAARQSDPAVVSQNGFAAGKMKSWSFDNNGIINAAYSNGRTEQIARVALASFSNSEGLLARGESTFIQSANSGAPTYFFADSKTTAGTTMLPGGLEHSNVDISLEMTNLIFFQRAYQFSSRIITTTDEMIKEAIALKR